MNFSEILRKEVVPAIGCTEPIAVALCVARAKEQLGQEPKEIEVVLSKNIYKNAMAVGIPNTGMTGLPIAIALGATVGHSEYMLEVLRDVDEKAVAYAKEYMARTNIHIAVAENAPDILYIHATAKAEGKNGTATIQGTHTHFLPPEAEQELVAQSSLVSLESGESKEKTHEQAEKIEESTAQNETAIGSMHEVWEYAISADVEEVAWLIEGAEMNLRAAQTSFEGKYGHGLGRLLYQTIAQIDQQSLSAAAKEESREGKRPIAQLFGNTLHTKILSYTCGACDARMSGAMVQVMSNSGSGNQGISCSVPVYVYAKENQCDREKTIRALTLSNLTVIYIKQSLGRLSALCGCVVAATGSAVGITYLMGGGYEEITYAIKNMVANISGMICDGAKPGCALKVTSGVSTAVLSASLAMQHSHADATEGIIEEDIDRTIHNLTRIGHDGMTQTDDLILDIMTHK